MKLLSVFSLTLSLFTFATAGQPNWIWSHEGDPGLAAQFRKTFHLSNPGKATLIAAGDNDVQIWINGQRTIRSAPWESPVTMSVKPMLLSGENTIAVRAKNNDGPAAVLVKLTVEDKEKGKVVFGTDSTWKTSAKLTKGWMENGYEEKGWKDSVVLAPLGSGPWKKITAEKLEALGNLREPEATPVDRIRLVDGFKAELLYSVPKDDQGSWVSMTIDDKGRLIMSDQYGGLYRMTPGETAEDTVIEALDIELGQSHGLLYAFDSLYAVVSNKAFEGRGLYRARDTDGDDQFDKVELLEKFAETGGEHGPHAPVLGPDGKSIYVVTGNQTAPPEIDASRVPLHWGEDLLTTRIYGRGFMKTAMAPGGWVAKTDPDGKEWELFSIGFRNQYDIAFNRDGEMFTYDADMEWDMNLPWYRPTRVCHVTSGSDWGWRNGSGKWPPHYADTLPPVADIGPGSPTGVTFGYGAKFPKKYEDALYVADWSYGKLYAVHLKPQGSTYTAEFEEFMSAQPLPLTDLAVNPRDGAMYVAIGGRRVQSGVYRVTWAGDDKPDSSPVTGGEALRELRAELEAFHGKQDRKAVAAALPQLGHKDRFIRHAARIALEHQPVAQWQDKVLGLENDRAAINGIVGLARTGEKSSQSSIIDRLSKVSWQKLPPVARPDLVRAYSLTLSRMGEPSESDRQRIVAQLSPRLPAKNLHLNVMLSELLVFLDVKEATAKMLTLLESEPTQEGQISYAKNIRLAQSGWTPELRKQYFEWFVKAASYRGGPSFDLFIKYIKDDAIANLPESAKEALQPIIDKKPDPEASPYEFSVRSFVKDWKVADFDDVIHVGLEGNRDFENGRNMYGAGTCFVCHRFDGSGGAVGPDLTSVGGKFSPRDLLETIIEPSKEISDQYGSMVFTKTDGSQVIGRIMNLSGDTVNVNTNMMDPTSTVRIDRKKVTSMEHSTISMMPPGLVNMMNKDDVLDLLAYLISGANSEDPMFAE
ncbi:MAG: heme-binding protein [Verrucomicrobiota bacterium]